MAHREVGEQGGFLDAKIKVYLSMFLQLKTNCKFRSIKRKRKPLGRKALAPCATSPRPETGRFEAKQLRMCLMLKMG